MKLTYIGCGLVCLALIAGCGGEQNGTDDTTAAGTGDSSAAPATTPAATTPEAPAGPVDFTGSSTGAVDVPNMSGTSAFWTTRAGGVEFWVLNMYPKGPGEGRISITRNNKSRPEVGEYQIGEEDLAGTVFGAVFVPADPSTSVKATSGKLVISSSAPDKVTGTYEFDGLQANMANLTEPGKPVTMKGSFTATCIGQQATGNVCE